MQTKYKTVSKTACIFLAATIVACGITACRSNEEKKEVVVLKNQQKEIDDVLAIKKINDIDNFRGEYLLKNGNILGIKGIFFGEDNKDIPNISIYDTEKDTFKILSSNGEKGKVWLSIEGITKDERYVLYEKLLEWDNWDQKRNVYIIDLKTGTEKKIADEVHAVSRFGDENKVIVAKGMALYMYDVDGNKTEIKLPEEMIRKMKDFSRLSFEEFIKKTDGENSIDEETRRERKERYEYEKENNRIQVVGKKGDEICVVTYNQVPFSYNLKTNTYKELTGAEAKKFYFDQESSQKVAKLEKKDSGTQELWELDEAGKHKKLIAKGKFKGGIKVSPNHTKVVYSLYGEKGDQNVFVYSFETGKSIKIFPKAISTAVWDESSKRFFMTAQKHTKEGYHYYKTSVVTLK